MFLGICVDGLPSCALVVGQFENGFQIFISIDTVYLPVGDSGDIFLSGVGERASVIFR